YPQPENPGYSTMLTSLEMAPTIRDADGECTDFVSVYIPDGAGGFTEEETSLCDVETDDTGEADWRLADKRKDILNASNVQIERLIAANQGASEIWIEYDGSGG